MVVYQVGSNSSGTHSEYPAIQPKDPMDPGYSAHPALALTPNTIQERIPLLWYMRKRK